MFELEEVEKIINEISKDIIELKKLLEIDNKTKLKEELENKVIKEDFWNDSASANKTLKEITRLTSIIKKYEKVTSQFKFIKELLEILKEDYDEGLKIELEKNIQEIKEMVEEITTKSLLQDKYDSYNAIVTLHPGAGGTEALDWVQMLYRMYQMWANQNNYKIEEIDFIPGEEAGIKSVSFIVSGEFAYGYLKSEQGVHRLIRISPFDSNKRRHTTFASVEVLPEIDEEIEININPEDLRIDTYHASGAGGQHINKTSSAVRITHLPTNIVVSCQNERSQLHNKETALKMLKSKLLALKEQENLENINELKGKQLDIAWGSQIRSYVFCPYTLVKDHRTGFETGNVDAVMNGDLNKLMEEYLKFINKKQ